MTRVTRRQFGTTTASAVGHGRQRQARGRRKRPRAPRLIGVGNRGDQVLDAFVAQKDAEIVADVTS